MIADGRLPNLARMIVEGASGTVRAEHPLRSPALWTTVATGVSSVEHGIDDFFRGRRRVSSAERRAEALWEGVSASSRTVLVVGWMATWPAERVRGAVVSDQALNPEVREGRVSPPDALAGMPTWAAWDYKGSESVARLRRYLGFAWEPRYAELWPEDSPEYRRHGLVARRLAWVLMRDESHTRIAERLLGRLDPALVLLHLWGPDHASHAFWRQAFGDAPAEEKRLFGGAVAAAYETLDAQLGRLRRAAGKDVVVMALSDHGFEAWTPPAGDPHPDLNGNHSPEAVLLIAGPGVRAGARIENASHLDLAPTVLRLLDLPAPSGLKGRALEEAFSVGALSPPRPSRATLRPGPAASSAVDLSPSEVERLRAMGYLR